MAFSFFPVMPHYEEFQYRLYFCFKAETILKAFTARDLEFYIFYEKIYSKTCSNIVKKFMNVLKN